MSVVAVFDVLLYVALFETAAVALTRSGECQAADQARTTQYLAGFGHIAAAFTVFRFIAKQFHLLHPVLLTFLSAVFAVCQIVWLILVLQHMYSSGYQSCLRSQQINDPQHSTLPDTITFWFAVVECSLYTLAFVGGATTLSAIINIPKVRTAFVRAFNKSVAAKRLN